MQNDFRSELYISTCPRCGTRLMCGKIIVTGLQKCSKCNRHWVIQMEKNKISVTRASLYFEEFAIQTEYCMRHIVSASDWV